jgi:hypothetical protein
MRSAARQVLVRWLSRAALDASFRKFVDEKTWRNPETENDVQFDSLPREEQARIFRQWKDRDKEPEKERKSPRGVIPVDKTRARAKAKELADRVVGMKFREPDESLWMNRTQPWPLDAGRIVIHDVKGQEHHIAVQVVIGEPDEEGWRAGRSLVNGGKAHHSHHKFDPHGHGFPSGIEIEVNRNKTPSQLEKGRKLLEDEIYNVLIHELTHSQDIDESMAQKEKRRKTQDEKDPKVYYNLPHEVRAFTQQVTDEIEKALEKNYGNREDPWFPDDRDLLEGFLGQSVTWDRVKKYMTPENRKKVLRSTYSAVAEFTKRQKSKKVARAWLSRRVSA